MNKFRLRYVCQQYLEDLRGVFGDRNILQMQFSPQLPDWFEGNSSHVGEALKTLVHFVASNMVNGIVRIEFTPTDKKEDDARVLLKVLGMGMAGTNIESLEKSKEQLINEFKAYAPGFAQTIEFEKGKNQIALQVAVDLKRINKSVPEKQLLAGKRFLLAEDNEVNVIVFSSFLDEWNTSYHVVDNGEHAVSSVRSKNYDAVLMDIHMPIMDGIEAIRQIRKFDEDIPIVVLSAVNHQDDIKMALDMGGNAFLKKPVTSWELYSTLVKFFKQ